MDTGASWHRPVTSDAEEQGNTDESLPRKRKTENEEKEPSTKSASTASKKFFFTGPGLNWNTEFPCYEIINIEFEDGVDSDSSTDTEEEKPDLIDFFSSGGDPGHLANVHVKSEDLGKNIVLDLEDDELKLVGVKKTVPESTSSDAAVKEDVIKIDPDEGADGKPWICVVCKEVIDEYKAFQEHFTSQHQDLNACPECSEEMPAATTSVLDHIVKVHLKRWACSACSLSFFGLHEYADHQAKTHEQEGAAVRHNSGEIRCRPCKSKFRTYSLFLQHFVKRHKSSCPTCHDAFNYKSDVVGHVFEKHLQCNFSCEEFNCSFASPSPFLVLTHCAKLHAKTIRTCPICKKRFFTLAHYEAHKHWHKTSDPDRPLRCDICGLNFAKRHHLSAHRTKHFNESRRNPCTQCEKVFHTALQLREHLKTHSKDTPDSELLKCPICDLAFTWRRLLTKHLKVVHDTDSDPTIKHKCSTCGNEYMSIPSLQRHIRMAHDDKDKTEGKEEEEEEEGEGEKGSN